MPKIDNEKRERAQSACGRNVRIILTRRGGRTGWFQICSHGDVNYNLTQFLTGHDGHRFEHDDSPFCAECINEYENREHILFVCPRFANETEQLQFTSGDDHSGNARIPRVGYAVSSTISCIQEKLRKLECLRKSDREGAILIVGVSW